MSGTSTSAPVGPVITSALPPPEPPEPPPVPDVSPPYVPPTYGGDPTIAGCGLPGIRFFQSYLWKFIVTDLDSITITSLDRLVSNRRIVKTLNDATEISFTVPSDNIRVNLAAADGDPKVSEGVRMVYGFRHETTGAWTCRASGLILQAHDAPQGDTVFTECTAWDPWKYLDYLPILNTDDPKHSTGMRYWSSDYTGPKQPTNVNRYTVDQMIIDQLSLAIVEFGAATTNIYNSIFIDFGQFPDFYNGTIETVHFPEGDPGYFIQNGTSIGQFLRDITQEDSDTTQHLCDIVLTPVYDPINRPGILAEMSILNRAGSQRNTAIMSWNRMPRTLTGIDRMTDGTERANNIQNYHSRGGPPVLLKTDAASLLKYRTYFHSKFFPQQGGQVLALENLATAQLLIRQSGVETITVSPTPERAKVPFLDYDVGDVVPIYSTNNMRQAVFDYYRVLQIPIDISDEALETVDSLTLKKRVINEPQFGPQTQFATAVTGNQVVSQLLRRSSMSSLPGP